MYFYAAYRLGIHVSKMVASVMHVSCFMAAFLQLLSYMLSYNNRKCISFMIWFSPAAPLARTAIDAFIYIYIKMFFYKGQRTIKGAGSRGSSQQIIQAVKNNEEKLTIRRRIIYIYVSIPIFRQAWPDFFRVLTTRKNVTV